ncbi:hypothetical protein BOX15_Mlig027268g1 [Macrostomum lignano]|uniref:PH domain-containing protein n=1 Tax=Macrostomum lignano TaxID=282301 RepID=A0A267EPP1_9PLAT|nr:hypothetical protein BOX15_Mlig027268g1 [Macrostomum lignano]
MSLSRNLDCNFDLDQEVQQHGILSIRGDIPTKWQKRFCIVKDSFLLIFKDDEAARIKKSSYFNIKSLGVIPLGDCLVSPYSDQTTSHGIEITAYSSQESFFT